MTSLLAYNQRTGKTHTVNEYESEEMATNRALRLNEYWQSNDRVIKSDLIYGAGEKHLRLQNENHIQMETETHAEMRQIKQRTKALPVHLR